MFGILDEMKLSITFFLVPSNSHFCVSGDFAYLIFHWLQLESIRMHFVSENDQLLNTSESTV